jgi:fructokinase
VETLFGGIEAGGTKFICAIGTGPDDIRQEMRFPTTSPEETLQQAIRFFRKYQKSTPLASVGIATFGPVDLVTNSKTYGYITTTPKSGWSQVSFAKVIQQELDLPVGFDTDVNGALLGEHRWGAAKDIDNAIYLTIGTGIGGAALVNGRLVHGLVHPEMGHLIVPPREDDNYPGGCPFHGNCLEGMANGPAIEKRWGARAETLSKDHPAWELEAYYLGKALHSLICILSPQRIILGGGVMAQVQLFPMVRQMTLDSLNNYVQNTEILGKIDNFIVPPSLGNRAGVLGAIALAEDVI